MELIFFVSTVCPYKYSIATSIPRISLDISGLLVATLGCP